MFHAILVATLELAQVGPGYVPVRDPALPTYYICVNDRGSYVNLRSAPSTSARPLARLYENHQVSIHRRVPVNGMWWAAVVTERGKAGWVRDDYICVF